MNSNQSSGMGTQPDAVRRGTAHDHEPPTRASSSCASTLSHAHRTLEAAQLEDWLTPEYVADHLALSRRDIYRRIRRGEFGEILRISRKALRVSRAGYQAFVKARMAA